MFIRVLNSESGDWDISVGQAGQVLVSNGPTAAPSFVDLAPSLRGFSYNRIWEKEFADRLSGGVLFGVANFTSLFERGLGPDTTGQSGAAAFTTMADVAWTKRV